MLEKEKSQIRSSTMRTFIGGVKMKDLKLRNC